MKKQSKKNSLLSVFGISPQLCIVLIISLFTSGILLGLLTKNDTSIKKKIPAYKQVAEEKSNEIDLTSSEEKDNAANLTDVVSTEESDIEEGIITPMTTLFDENKLPVIGKITGPVIALVIDDMGVDLIHTQQILKLNDIYTVSYLTYAPNLQAQIDFARSKGKEVLLHVPMESVHEIFDYGPEVLLTTNSRSENLKTLSTMLGRASGYIGINNHMGSKFTADLPLLSAVIEELAGRGLMFLDSKTTPKSQAENIIGHIRLPFASRDIFIDDSNKPEDIEKYLQKAELIAKKRGYVVAIAHPRPNTIKAFEQWLPSLKSKGITVVPLSYVVDNFSKIKKVDK
ncbi:MAG: divergent polysaccharide deacetylase family protein [Alphaproteobacteria bacterium]|nr:divergent polysaccharide deacetylase family protein [Alphaproteobacteria bacterium]